MESPLFFKNKTYSLFGVLHEPEPNKHNELNNQATGIVFCYPFAEEKVISQRVMVNLSRRLTEHGLYCLRFDYMGHGDSDGNFEDSTVETRLSDIRCAVNYLRDRIGLERVGLLGVRLGATLAALMPSEICEIDPLIMISPIIKGKPYIDQCLRSNLTLQMAAYKKVTKDRKALIEDLMSGKTVNIDGYLLTKTLYQQIEAVNLLEGRISCPRNGLIIQVSRKQDQPIEKGLNELYNNLRAMSSNVEIKGVHGGFFWADSQTYNPRSKCIEEELVDWLCRTYFV